MADFEADLHRIKAMWQRCGAGGEPLSFGPVAWALSRFEAPVPVRDDAGEPLMELLT